MPELVPPDVRVRESFLEAMREVVAEGNRAEAAYLGSEQTRYRAEWNGPEGFAEYVATVRADGAETTPRRIGIVPHTTWWWVDGEDYLGRISVRHRLTEFLRDVGGHVGYYVRPSRRRRGHATAMLRAVLPVRGGPRPRAGAGHLRRHERGLAPRDRGGRRRARGPTGGQAPLLAADALTPPHR